MVRISETSMHGNTTGIITIGRKGHDTLKDKLLCNVDQIPLFILWTLNIIITQWPSMHALSQARLTACSLKSRLT